MELDWELDWPPKGFEFNAEPPKGVDAAAAPPKGELPNPPDDADDPPKGSEFAGALKPPNEGAGAAAAG